MQNSALGAYLALAHFPDPLTAVPCAISACTHSLMGSAIAGAWRWSDLRGAGVIENRPGHPQSVYNLLRVAKHKTAQDERLTMPCVTASFWGPTAILGHKHKRTSHAPRRDSRCRGHGSGAARRRRQRRSINWRIKLTLSKH